MKPDPAPDTRSDGVVAARREYVLGLLFSEDLSSIVLIRKNRPAWQAGLLNGVGGKIEPGEQPLYAVVREFREETGVATDPLRWRAFAELSGDDFIVHCFAAFNTATLSAVKSATDEQVAAVPVARVARAACVLNLRWLIPLALESRERPAFMARVAYGPSPAS